MIPILFLWMTIVGACDTKLNINDVGFCENPLRFISVNNETVAYFKRGNYDTEIILSKFKNYSHVCYMTLAAYLCAIQYAPCSTNYDYCSAADSVIQMHISSGLCPDLSNWYHKNACDKFSSFAMKPYMMIVFILLAVLVTILYHRKQPNKLTELQSFRHAGL